MHVQFNNNFKLIIVKIIHQKYFGWYNFEIIFFKIIMKQINYIGFKHQKINFKVYLCDNNTVSLYDFQRVIKQNKKLPEG